MRLLDAICNQGGVTGDFGRGEEFGGIHARFNVEVPRPTELASC